MLNIIVFIVGLIGACLVSLGAWILSPACGFITAGVLCIVWSYSASKMIAINLNHQDKEG